MADPYIDPHETQIYGPFCRDQMQEVCNGRLKELDGMVRFAITKQTEADDAMKAILARQPRAATVDTAELLAEARDIIVRFGSHIDSLKGRPLDPKLFFRGEAPSVLARRRITKLVGAVRHMADEAKKAGPKLKDKSWLADLEELHEKLSTVEKQQRAAKVDKVELSPEVAAGREAWLSVYNANKNLIRGLLAHVGKPELLPLIFDDLAEVHRASGVSDDVPPDAPPADKGQGGAPA